MDARTCRRGARRLLLPLVFGLMAGCGNEPTGGPVGVDRILVSTGVLTLDALGASDTLQASAVDGSGLPLEVALTWTSSDPSVLQLSQIRSGAVITARADGTADVIVSHGDVEAVIRVTVAQAFARMDFRGLPTALRSGTPLALEVAPTDRLGTPLKGATGSVRLQLTGAGGVQLAGGLEAPLVDGWASFPDLSVQGSGFEQRIEARTDQRTGSSGAFDVVLDFDRVHVLGVPTGVPAGVLVDGRAGGTEAVDLGYVGADAAGIEVGSVRSGLYDEVLAFAPDRAPGWVTGALWSDAPDVVQVATHDPVVVDLAVWIVKGPFEAQRDWALDAVQRTREIWAAERYGVSIGDVEVIDVTNHPDASRYHVWELCGARPDIEARIGRRDGRINLYYVERVDGGQDRGRTCPVGGDFVVMAERSGDELLSHEIGHVFGMGHVDGLMSWFDRTNVMHSASSTRAYLTEGQTFRSHASPFSALNGVLGVRSGPTRSCPEGLASAACPALERRLWSDGAVPRERGPDRRAHGAARRGDRRSGRALAGHHLHAGGERRAGGRDGRGGGARHRASGARGGQRPRQRGPAPQGRARHRGAGRRGRTRRADAIGGGPGRTGGRGGASGARSAAAVEASTRPGGVRLHGSFPRDASAPTPARLPRRRERPHAGRLPPPPKEPA
ncbi:MAG: Ig-like domain-containing protein [Gemmatimonadota bacterium]